MKNVMKFGLALVAFFSAFTMHANDGNFSVSVKSGKVISFAINEAKNVHVSIFNTDGGELFDEVLRSKDDNHGTTKGNKVQPGVPEQAAPASNY